MTRQDVRTLRFFVPARPDVRTDGCVVTLGLHTGYFKFK
jgi:hypothetical protein